MTRLSDARLWDLSPELQAKGPRPKEPKSARRRYEESENQIAFFNWWRMTHADFGLPACVVFAIPNGSALGTGKEDWQIKQRMIRGKRLKSEGLTPGVFDIFISVPRKPFSGCYLEMKKLEGEPSKEQIDFSGHMTMLGYKTAYAFTAQQAIDITTSYLTQ